MKPLSRSQLMQGTVTEVSGFTSLRYLGLRKDAPNLGKLEEQAQSILPNGASATLDLFYSLYDQQPELKPAENTPATSQYWRSILGNAMETTAYQQMHAKTAFDELTSLIGTITMGQSVLGMISDEDKEKLEEMAQAEAELQEALQDAGDAGAQAQADAQALAGLQQALGNSQSRQAKQAIQQAQEQAQQSQSKAQAAQMTLEQAQALAEQLNQQLMGQPDSTEAQAKQTELKRLAQAAANKAATEVKEVSELLQSWGMEPGELKRSSAAEAMDIVKRMRQSEEFKKFQELLGRMRHIAQRKSASNHTGEGYYIPKVRYGNDLTDLDPSEFLAFAHPVLKFQFLNRWAKEELRLTERIFKETLGKGPVVVLEDGSGSMSGIKKLWSKAVCLTLAYYAKLEGRTFVWIHFGSKSSRLICKVYPKGNLTPKDMLEIAETFLDSGTDFEKPLDKALEVIEQEGLNKADIAMVTDGECAVAADWLSKFLARKQKMGVNVITVLMDVGESSIASVRQFSDRVDTVSQFTAEEAGQKVISNLT